MISSVFSWRMLEMTYCAHFQVQNFILGYYLNMFTCFPAQKTVFLILYCIPPLSETLCCCIYKTTERQENKAKQKVQ